MPANQAAVEQRMKRWQEQRWLLDAVIRMVGPDWDQGRLSGLLRACGPAAAPDIAAARSRMRKFDDMSREFARVAVRRERIARTEEEQGHLVAARESYFIAALFYASAQWPIFENSPENQRLDQKKVESYSKYAQFADHEVRKAEIPFQGKSLPGWLHLPSDRSAGPVPCVISIPGMDAFKEGRVAMYGDPMLERGVAVLTIEGPGQYEALLRGIHADTTNWLDAGKEMIGWVRSQPELDPDRVGVTGSSFGSFWATQVASVDDRLKGCAVRMVAHEPARYTLFHMESPTFKLRFMFMSGYEDEEEFDRFMQGMNLEGVGEKISCPYLVVAGEDDSHSPIEYTYSLLDTIRSPKELILYEGADHGVAGSSSTELGPNPGNYLADWLVDRLKDKPMVSRHSFVDLGGNVEVTGFEEATRRYSWASEIS